MNESVSLQMKGMNERMVQNNKNQLSGLHDVERRLDRIVERLDERPQGKLANQSQPNPAQAPLVSSLR